MNINVKKTREDAILPTYAHPTDAGMDLFAAEDVIIEPGQTVKVPTGIAFEIPAGFEMQIRPRSGITTKTKLRVQLGTVDAPYRGEISVIVDNITTFNDVYDPYYLTLDGKGAPVGDWGSCEFGTYLIRKGDKIAQAIVSPVIHAKLTQVDELGETDRGANGFGSTGLKGDE